MKNKVKVTIVIEVNKKSKAAEEWEDVDDFVDDEIKETIREISAKYWNWNPEDAGIHSHSTTWKYETDEI